MFLSVFPKQDLLKKKVTRSRRCIMCFAVCPKCDKHKKVTRHHILPRRFFGSPPNAPILLICRSCHTDLEQLIPEKELQSHQFYWSILFVFLKTDRIRVIEWSGNRSYVVWKKYEMPPLPQATGQLLGKFL